MVDGSKSAAKGRSGGVRVLDLFVIAAAGLFFVNIVVGTPNDDDQLLFLAAEMGGSMEAQHAFQHNPVWDQ